MMMLGGFYLNNFLEVAQVSGQTAVKREKQSFSSRRRRRSARMRCFAQSRADFRSKLTIALKEASETRYWMLLLIDNNIVPESKLAMMLDELNQIIKILIATTKKLKE